MVNLDDAIVARLESHGETFEILLSPAAIDRMRAGKEVDFVEYLAVEAVFNNASRGTKPTDEKIMEAFGTMDMAAIARRIIDRGTVQITAEQRKEMLEATRRRIVGYIAANAINPQTRTPHPPNRIDMALEEAKFKVDPFKSVDQQVDAAMALLRKLIPIRFEKVRLAIKLPGADYGRCFDDVTSAGMVEREEWLADGSWACIVEIPAGIINELTAKLKDKTRGSAETRLVSE
ncbi:MAG: ribosome assembly factor SBDS [Thermoplasmatales archaeon]|nr:ribosome assembly factor SBDS [Thermoplasmatales archaeon]